VKLLALVIAVLVIATVVTLSAMEDPGYVLMARGPWSAEMALTVFIPLALLAFLAFALVLYATIRLLRIPRDVQRWRTRRQARRGRDSLLKGMTYLAEGSWVEAEAALLAGMRHSDAALLNCLGAAFAAQGQGNVEKRDEYLAQAQQLAPQAGFAIGMTQAVLQQLNQQVELALATLTELRGQHPHHKQLLKLLAQVARELRDWPGVIDLMSELRKNQVMSAQDLDALEVQAHRELLTLSLPAGSGDVLRQAWKAVPKHLRKHPALVAPYARQLILQGEHGEAEIVLRDTIETEWNETLVELFGRLRPAQAGEAVELAETWASSHPDNARAQLTAARLAAAAAQKDKARGYYERCVALRGPIDAYRELGALLEDLGEREKASEFYRRGLEAYSDEARKPGGRARPILQRIAQ
jgi:HemY protein